MDKDEQGVPISMAGCFIVEGYDRNDPEALKTLPPMTILSHRSQLIQNAQSGLHHDVKVDKQALRRLIAWVDLNGPFLGKEEIRQMYDPKIPHIETIPVRPRLATAPDIQRFNLRQDGDSWAIAGDLKLAPDDIEEGDVGDKLPKTK